MPWKCPACQTPIRHDAELKQPRPGAIYRCHLCRLELIFNPQTGQLVPARKNPEGND